MEQDKIVLQHVVSKLPLENTPNLVGKEDDYQKVIYFIEHLINHDFHQLLSILYRLDVDEQKVRKVVSENKGTTSAGVLITQLILEREREKMEFRKKYSNR